MGIFEGGFGIPSMESQNKMAGDKMERHNKMSPKSNKHKKHKKDKMSDGKMDKMEGQKN